MRRILSALFTVGVAFTGGLLAGTTVVRSAWSQGTDHFSSLDTLARAMTTIEQQYVDPVDPDKLVYGAIDGMVQTLDPYSSFLPPSSYQELLKKTSGQNPAVGILLSIDTPQQTPMVRGLTPGGPAELAGVKESDLLLEIDGKDVRQLDLETIAPLLSGPKGTPVALTLSRDGQPVRLTVVRDEPAKPGVTEGQALLPGIAYIRVEAFRWRTTIEIQSLIDELVRQSAAPPKGLIIDLRGNPGGLLDEAIGLADLFLAEGQIVETRGRDGNIIESVEAKAQDTDLTLPLVLLVDENSASASELVASALQDHGRATIVGAATTGKGVYQRVYEFEDGAALYLTVARYFRPNGKAILPDASVLPDVPTSRSQKLDLNALAQLPPKQRLSADAQLRAAVEVFTGANGGPN